DRAVDLAFDLAAHQDELPPQVLELFRKVFLHDRLSLPTPALVPERIGRQDLQILLQDLLRQPGGNRSQDDAAVEDALERARVLRSRAELGPAVRPRRGLELELTRPDAARYTGDDLPVAAVEPVRDPQDRRELLDHDAQVRVQPPPVLVRLLGPPALVVAR